MRNLPFAFAFAALVAAPAVPSSSADAARTPPARPEVRARMVPNTPRAAIRGFADAYEAGSSEQVAALLSADYRFHFSAGDRAGEGYLNGFDREHELKAVAGLFGRLGAMRIRIAVGGMEEGADPEHPDSLSHYRVVVARRFAFDMRGDSGQVTQSLPADQIFYMVRGDVAQRVDGQPGGADRWYIRRWMEDVHFVEQQLAGTDGHCEEAEMLAAGAGALAGVLAVRALEVPLCPTLEVVCDLPRAAPATLEVFDLQGRRLAKQVLQPSAPGPVRVQAGSGQRFAPGAYWLRLTQAGSPPGKRLVIVAR